MLLSILLVIPLCGGLLSMPLCCSAVRFEAQLDLDLDEDQNKSIEETGDRILGGSSSSSDAEDISPVLAAHHEDNISLSADASDAVAMHHRSNMMAPSPVGRVGQPPSPASYSSASRARVVGLGVDNSTNFLSAFTADAAFSTLQAASMLMGNKGAGVDSITVAIAAVVASAIIVLGAYSCWRMRCSRQDSGEIDSMAWAGPKRRTKILQGDLLDSRRPSRGTFAAVEEVPLHGTAVDAHLFPGPGVESHQVAAQVVKKRWTSDDLNAMEVKHEEKARDATQAIPLSPELDAALSRRRTLSESSSSVQVISTREKASSSEDITVTSAGDTRPTCSISADWER